MYDERYVMKLLRDTWLVFQRQVLLVIRTPIWVILGIVQPIIYLILFAPLLKPALASMGSNSMDDAYRIYVPGMLVALAIGTGLGAGFSLLGELRGGVIERSRVTPVSRLALLLGRSLRDVVTILAQSLIITICAIPAGLLVHLGNLLVAFLILSLISIMAASVSYGLAMILQHDGALTQVNIAVAQPIMLLSGCLLPIALGPLWLQKVAGWNPFGWAVDGMRALYAGHPGDSAVWQSILGVSALTAVALMWSARKFARTVN
jgi:ABC-2 type transport system permease protein